MAPLPYGKRITSLESFKRTLKAKYKTVFPHCDFFSPLKRCLLLKHI